MVAVTVEFGRDTTATPDVKATHLTHTDVRLGSHVFGERMGVRKLIGAGRIGNRKSLGTGITAQNGGYTAQQGRYETPHQTAEAIWHSS